MAVKVANYEFAGHVSRVVRFFSDLAIEVERRRARRMTRAILTGLTVLSLAIGLMGRPRSAPPISAGRFVLMVYSVTGSATKRGSPPRRTRSSKDCRPPSRAEAIRSSS